jgi:hypothetical protein
MVRDPDPTAGMLSSRRSVRHCFLCEHRAPLAGVGMFRSSRLGSCSCHTRYQGFQVQAAITTGGHPASRSRRHQRERWQVPRFTEPNRFSIDSPQFAAPPGSFKCHRRLQPSPLSVEGARTRSPSATAFDAQDHSYWRASPKRPDARYLEPRLAHRVKELRTSITPERLTSAHSSPAGNP